MGTTKEQINGIDVWFTTDNLRRLNENGDYEEQYRVLCYFNFREPAAIWGELIKGDNGIPMTFLKEQDALNYAKEYIKKIIGDKIL